MARILVTGASGFIGSHVAVQLATRGHRVVATGRSRDRLQMENGSADRTAVADLCTDPLEPLTDGCDAVVHCAALSSPWGSAEDFRLANVVATERLLAASRDAGVRRFIHLGSPSIYFRFCDQYQIGEDFTAPRRWITEYARSKWESELSVRAATTSRMGTIVLRPRAVFGERDRAILPRLLAVASRGWFPLFHQGNAMIDVTHVSNLAQLVGDCVEADVAADGRAYNITNAEPVSVRDLVSTLFSALDIKPRLVAVPRRVARTLAGLAEQSARLRRGRPEPRMTRYGVGVLGYSQTLDITRVQRELDYQPRVSVRAGIDQFAAWWRQHDSN